MKLQPVLRGIRRADQDFGLFEPGDRIAVALSGGKDSMLMFLALSFYQKFQGKDFSLCAIHIDMGTGKEETGLMKAFAAEHGLELHIVPTHIFDILSLPQNLKNGKIQCSLCSTLKKGTLIETAKNLGCNKLALGHHGDDALETLMMNLIHGARFATFSPVQYMSRMDLTMIRPFVYLQEDEIITACRINAIPNVKPVCPNDGFSERQRMKDLLSRLYAQFPDAHENFQKALTNRQQDRLWSVLQSKPAARPDTEPAAGSVPFPSSAKDKK